MTENFVYPGNELEMFSKAKNWKKYMTRFIKPHIKGRVLEAGAGLGVMTSLLNSDQNAEWILLEPDAKMAKLIQKKKDDGILNKNCTVINGTIENAGVLLFDTIIYIDVLEHIESDRKEIANSVKLLNPGGKLVILCPAFQFLFSPFDAIIGHYRRYTKKTLRNVAEHSLKEVLMRYMDSAGFFASLANKLLLRQKYPTQKQIIFWDRFLVPASFYLDKFFLYAFGKSILGIWQK